MKPCSCPFGRGVHCPACDQHVYLVQNPSGGRFWVTTLTGRADCPGRQS